jgi:hypothetical protein
MRSLALFLLLAGAAAGARAGEKPAAWTEVRSPHFVTLSDGGEPMARRAAEEFEKVRAAFGQRVYQFRLDGETPTIILALKSESSMKKLLPEFWAKRGGMRPDGVFFHASHQGPDQAEQKNYAVVRMDLDEGARHVVFHEYVHELTRLNYKRPLPSWLNEGIAEFYGNCEVNGLDVTVGRADPDTGFYLRRHAMIPMPELLGPEAMNKAFGNAIYAHLFYSQSWLLTHYLIFGKGMGSGERLNQYVDLVVSGADPVESFVQTFGDLKTVQNELYAYLEQKSLPAFKIRLPESFAQMQFVPRQLTPEETAAALAAFHSATPQKE